MPSALTFSWKAGTECCRRLFTCQYVSNSIYFSVVAYIRQWLLPRGLKKSKYNKIFDNRLDICAFFPEYYFFLSRRKFGNVLRSCLLYLGFPAPWYPLVYVSTVFQVYSTRQVRVFTVYTYSRGGPHVHCVHSPRLCRARAACPILF